MPNISEAKQAIYALKDKTKFERLIFSTAIFTELLLEHQIKPIIVGGLAVEIYSQSGYTTQDTDLVMDGYEIADEILKELDFQKIGKDWIHPVVGISIEIPSNFLTGDYNKVTELPLDENMKVYVIGIEDIILDRLRSAVHWKSGEDREWGYRLLLIYFEDIDFVYIEANFQHPSEKDEFEDWLAEARDEKNRIK
ncbi:hypothetical protein GC098_21170 [Paenibacillus sp. LMG 31458]|uniref:DUF6036 domain-containing protein n=1 Tax=Paenibacillus phytorum TaxID=2654977 RepID=A0ABX1XZ75_9BACL|nr:DUF6036 family nucleotidyltransferase [Paenibacillus phytorum]NOU73878.1 hypothetical protein [Paenibacillus phytorum]